MKLKNTFPANGSINRELSDYLLEYWKEQNNPFVNICPSCKRLTSNLYGSHVYDMTKQNRYVIPLCSACYLEKDKFEIPAEYLVNMKKN